MGNVVRAGRELRVLVHRIRLSGEASQQPPETAFGKVWSSPALKAFIRKTGAFVFHESDF